MKTPNPKKVLIVLAIGSGQEGTTRWETSYSLISLVWSGSSDYEFTLVPAGGCDVAHARNLATHQWIDHTDCDICIHIDSDMKFRPEQFWRLLSWLAKPDVMICGGMYPRKGLRPKWSYEQGSDVSKAHPELWEVGEICTGFLGMKRQLVEEMIVAYPETAYVIDDKAFEGETGHELFAMGPVTRDWRGDGKPYSRRMSEDFMFSLRAKELGHTIYADPKIQLGHIGTIDFLELMASQKGGA